MITNNMPHDYIIHNPPRKETMNGYLRRTQMEFPKLWATKIEMIGVAQYQWSLHVTYLDMILNG